MVERTFSDTTLKLSALAPNKCSSVRDLVPADPRAAPRFILGTVLAAGLFLSPATGDVRWSGQPAGGMGERSSVVGTSMPPRCCSLASLADTALSRMSPEQQSLYKEIKAIRDGFGSTVDVNALVREIRENAG